MEIQPTASLWFRKPDDVVLIGEVVADKDFLPCNIVEGAGVNDQADYMDPTVAAFVSPSHKAIVFLRRGNEDVADEMLADGWILLGYNAVRYYGTWLEYQSSPG